MGNPTLNHRKVIQEWYCVQAKSHSEVRRALEHISALGFETFAPTFYEHSKTSERLHKPPLKKLVFGSYFFMRFSRSKDKWRSVWYLPGVRKIFSNGPENPVQVRPWIINSLKASYPDYSSSFRPSHIIPKVYEVGAVVKVVDGPWVSFTGFVQQSTEERVTVLLWLFGRDTPIEFNANSLKAA